MERATMFEDALEKSTADARQQPSADPVQEALDDGLFVCPMLGRACLERDCRLYVYGMEGPREHAGTGCAWAVMARALHGLDAMGIEVD